MNRTFIEEQLKKLIVESCTAKDLSFEDIKAENDLINDFMYDSISLIQLIVNIEETFGIRVEDSLLTFEVLSHYEKLLEFIEKAVKEVGGINDNSGF